MIEIKGNLWHQTDADAICITTNGFVTSTGNAVMGMGCAKQYVDSNPSAKTDLGNLLRANGNIVQIINPEQSPVVVSFPVKPVDGFNCGTNVVIHAINKYHMGQLVPGFHCKADRGIIHESTEQLVRLTTKMGWDKVVLPRPGCGAGELHWPDVKRILDSILDGRFYCITY